MTELHKKETSNIGNVVFKEAGNRPKKKIKTFIHGKVFITRNLSRVGGKGALTTSLVQGIKLLLYAKIDVIIYH